MTVGDPTVQPLAHSPKPTFAKRPRICWRPTGTLIWMSCSIMLNRVPRVAVGLTPLGGAGSRKRGGPPYLRRIISWDDITALDRAPAPGIAACGNVCNSSNSREVN